MADRLEEAEHRLSTAACEHAPQILARLLLTVPTAHQEDNGTVTVRDLSKEAMAGWVGVRRETIERTLKRWRENGTIRTGYREVNLIDLPKLARIAKLLPGTGRSTAASGARGTLGEPPRDGLGATVGHRLGRVSRGSA